MELQFKNKHIYFALSEIWYSSALDYRFKYQINELVTLNSDDEYVQTISIDCDTLTYLFDINTKKPEGISSSSNKDMVDFLLPQLTSLAESVMLQKSQDPEAVIDEDVLTTLANINNIVTSNYQKIVTSILESKKLILS